jgi:pyridoxamine 5'-phosphate oxidase
MAMADFRRDYHAGELGRDDLGSDPLAQFQRWFDQAAAAHSGGRWRKIGIAIYKLWQALLGHAPADVNAMTLATVDKDGQPSARTVLLKGADRRGFIFFTNYDSRKGHELTGNPNAALNFYWPELERQVCVAGTVTKLPPTESDAYFRSRPRGSRLAAWASNQSDVVENRAALEQQWQVMSARFPSDEIPCPPNWGGYVLAPERIEFWQGRPSRLHDRFCYTKRGDGVWQIERLSP